MKMDLPFLGKFVFLIGINLLLLLSLVESRKVVEEKFLNGKVFYHYEKEKSNLIGGDKTDHVKTKWFNQTLDHFSPTDSRTWLQRYFVNDEFYKPGGPVFLQIGGEGEATPKWMTAGAWVEYGKRLNALLFQVEHRFYGKSRPTENLSVKNLRFLSSEQALADLASFTIGMKNEYKLKTNKWVAFGGSYPGSLAAWYRMKYPHLVDMSVSSSAPLVAKLDFKEYLGVVRDALNRTNPTCVSEINKAVRSVEGLLKRRTGWWMIKQHFR